MSFIFQTCPATLDKQKDQNKRRDSDYMIKCYNTQWMTSLGTSRKASLWQGPFTACYFSENEQHMHHI